MSSPRGTFSQAELTADRVITRCITRSMSVPGATIRAMAGDLERLPVPVPVSAAASGAGPAAVAAELLSRVRAELPAVGELEERDQILLAAWLTGLRSARTRRASRPMGRPVLRVVTVPACRLSPGQRPPVTYVMMQVSAPLEPSGRRGAVLRGLLTGSSRSQSCPVPPFSCCSSPTTAAVTAS